ncbi:MAG: hypothetical protein K9J74_09660 [Sulfuritalea sp.]|nr:hypothetical protein [Sulfuritalea sp.]
MNPVSRLLARLASTVGFYGGDSIHLRALKPGRSKPADIHERLGPPEAKWSNDDGSATWEYPRGPEGTQCWMLTLDDRGVLQHIEQALSEESFARIQTGWSAERVRRLLGKPRNEMEFPLKPEVVWEWRVATTTPGADAFFHVHFSPNGFVTGTSRREDSPGGDPS